MVGGAEVSQELIVLFIYNKKNTLVWNLLSLPLHRLSSSATYAILCAAMSSYADRLLVL